MKVAVKVAFFDTHSFEREAFLAAQKSMGLSLEFTFFEHRLTRQTASLSAGHDIVCAFVNDTLNEEVLRILAAAGVQLIALRSAGFNHVDMAIATRLGLPVVRVPEYSPHAVAEHAIALILSLNRKIPRASARVRDHNFSLEGLVGFDLYQKTVGVIGTGRIGSVMARIMKGFGCRVIAYDPNPNAELIQSAVKYVDLAELYRSSDIISLHAPLTAQTRHLIDENALAQMKPGAMLINTSRGLLIDTKALIHALKTGQLGYAGLDVYEEEEGLFFSDHSSEVLKDDQLTILLTYPNVIVTSHQAFLTAEALSAIAATTLGSIADFAAGAMLKNQIK